MKDRIGIVGELVVIKIDPDSGKVVEKRKVENVLTYQGADRVISAVYRLDPGHCEDYTTEERINKLVLLDGERRVIKQIPDGYITEPDIEGPKLGTSFLWRDTDVDSYEAYYAGLGFSGWDYYEYGNEPADLDWDFVHVVVFSPPFTKSFNERVIFYWNIYVPYTPFSSEYG